MKNTEIDLKGLKVSAGLKKIRSRTRLCYVVYPLAFFCLVLGVIFALEDGIRVIASSIKNADGTEDATKGTSELLLEETKAEETEIPKAPHQEIPYVMGIDDLEPLGLSEYYYLNRDVLPDDIYGFNYNLVPQGHKAIVPISLARESNGEEMYIKNKTDYDINAEDYVDFKLPEYTETDEYTVLIIHTHGTEAYTPDGVLSDDPNDPYFTRSEDNEENMVSVGAVMAEIFEKNGIKTLHHTVAVDTTIDDYSKAYSASAKIIKDTLKKYPSIKYVFDVHRDGVMLSTGEKAKAVCRVDGKLAAQVMTVVGSDFLGQDHPNWENNLAFAVLLQNRLEEAYTDICRPITLKQGAFNQHLSPMGLLLEIGTDGNTLQEAKYSAEILAREISALITNAD